MYYFKATLKYVLIFAANVFSVTHLYAQTPEIEEETEDLSLKQTIAADEKQANTELRQLEEVIGKDASDNADVQQTQESAIEQTQMGDTEQEKEIVDEQEQEAVVESSEGDETEQEAESEKENLEQPWLPTAKEYDWIQLTSGEWLKGVIKSMYNEMLEFDSDKLGIQEIDWDDVKFLKSYRPSSLHVENRDPVVGNVQISGDMVTVSNGDQLQEFDRIEIISLTPGFERGLDLWSIKLGLGFNVKSGNTDQVDYDGKLNAKRQTAKSRFILDYNGNISKIRNDSGDLIETVNNHRLNLTHDIYVTRYFFYRPASVEFYRDPFQNIDQRLTLGVNVGYTIFDTGGYEWDINGGPAYVSTRYLSVQPGEDREIGSFALLLGTDFDAEISDTLDFIFKYNLQFTSTEAGDYTHYVNATFENEITGSLDFYVSLIWDRITNPVVDDTGATPEQDDYRLSVGVAYTY